MRAQLSLLAAALLSAGVCACGGSSGNASSHTSLQPPVTDATKFVGTSLAPAPVIAKADGDQDNDIGAPYDDTNNNSTLDFGHAASSSDRRAIISLVRRYYAIALAENGAKACSMVYSTLAESVPEDYGTAPGGPRYLRGGTCPVVVTKLFEHYHSQLAAEVPKLRVSRVRLMERHGLAVLTFGTMPERQISVEREEHIWRMATLLDGELS